MTPVTYLDHAATTPVRPEVAAAMAPYAAQWYGNASGAHRVARRARRALEDAREEVAALLGARPGEVVFTSGGTEAANLAVFGTLAARPAPPGAVVHSAVEHPAVLEPCAAAARGARAVFGVPGVERRVAPVDGAGRVDPGALGALLGGEVALVSVMAANNEVGTVQPLDEVAVVVRRLAPEAVLHTDAVQAAAHLDPAATAPCDLVSVSAHKLGGPKGAGALVVRDGVALAPLLYGGGQERERRSGTHDVAGAVGLAAALRACAENRPAETARLAALRDRLGDGLAALDGVTETVPRALTLPGHLHLLVEGVEREELLVLLDEEGLCASAGSSCASGALQESHVLAAMGLRPGGGADRAPLRLTLGHPTTAADVDRALAVVPAVLARLREATGAPGRRRRDVAAGVRAQSGMGGSGR